MRAFAISLTALLLVLVSTVEAQDARTQRKKIAVVLEGGGAKGFAHVGVLKVLEQERVPVDFIVGTSMGSIVGAAYASGRSISELEEVLASTDWDALFNETPPRREVHYRQKAGRERELFGDTKIGIRDGDIVTPLALVQGQNIEPMLQRLFGKVSPSVSFDALPVPFRAVAADIETGEAVILAEGSLATAARASMSVPGFFSPVEIGNHMLVDGGITNNLPVDVALSMGADVIIAVECKDHLRKRDKLNGPLAISGQILDLLLERNTQNALKLLRPQDIHLPIELGDFGSASFTSAPQIMALGEQEARARAEKFRGLSISETAYRRYAEHRTNGAEYSPVIDYVRVELAEGYQATEIEKTFEKDVGERLNRKDIEEKLTAIVQTGDYQKITYDIEDSHGKNGLILKAEPKAWLKNFARIGFTLEDDFDGGSNYSLALETRLNRLNELGAYLDLQLEAGKSPQALVEFYQPLFQESRFFVAPEVSMSQQEILLRDQSSIAAEYQRNEEVLALKGGYSLGKYGEFLLGWRWGRGDVNRHIGVPTLPDFDYDIGEAFGKFVIDQLDNPDFPTQGYRLLLTGTAARDGLGADSDFEKSTVVASVPFTF